MRRRAIVIRMWSIERIVPNILMYILFDSSSDSVLFLLIKGDVGIVNVCDMFNLISAFVGVVLDNFVNDK